LAVDADVTGPFERARTELLYGRRLSAARRTDEAGEHVVTAFATFERLGAGRWAHQAGEQIAAAGGAAPEPVRDLLERLTPLELEVALVAADGVAAREAAARLFLGPRSAQLHLASALAKLQLDDPGQLRGVMGERSSVAL
jgi:DNA-binding NarL/FixJ family response regulator